MFGIDLIYWVLINSAVSFIFLFIVSKILGKKQIAQLEFIDYAIGISLGSIAAEMATTDKPFYHYLIAMTIFFVLAYLTALIGRKAPFFKKVLKGKPATLIYEGKINYKEICKNNIDINDLLSMLREKGFFDINSVAYAIFEPSGKLSVLPKGEQTPTVISNLKDAKITPASLTNELVIDGRISGSGLSELGKDKQWLFKELKISNKKQIKQIALAVYDSQNKKVVVHYKKQ